MAKQVRFADAEEAKRLLDTSDYNHVLVWAEDLISRSPETSIPFGPAGGMFWRVLPDGKVEPRTARADEVAAI